MKKNDIIDPKPIGTGYFGNIYDQFRSKAKEAFDFLVAHQNGDLTGVFHNEDLGDIDLVWGSKENNKGLNHIIFKHIGKGKDFSSLTEAREIIETVINKGKKIKNRWDKVTFEHNGYRVIISKNIRNDKGEIVMENKNWVVTAFDNNNPKSKKHLISP